MEINRVFNIIEKPNGGNLKNIFLMRFHAYLVITEKIMTISAKGINIYKAAVAGAKRGYNNTTDDYTKYEAALQECFDDMLVGATAAQYAEVMLNTGGDWRNANLPLTFLKLHKHVRDGGNEWHARVQIYNKAESVIDIKTSDWNKLKKASKCIN